MDFEETCKVVASATWEISWGLLKLGSSILSSTAKDVCKLPSEVACSENMVEKAKKVAAVGIDVAGLGATFISPSLAASAAFGAGLVLVPAAIGSYFWPDGPTELIDPEFVECTRTKITLSVASVAASLFLKSVIPIAAVTGGFSFCRILLHQRIDIAAKEALERQPRRGRLVRASAIH